MSVNTPKHFWDTISLPGEAAFAPRKPNARAFWAPHSTEASPYDCFTWVTRVMIVGPSDAMRSWRGSQFTLVIDGVNRLKGAFAEARVMTLETLMKEAPHTEWPLTYGWQKSWVVNSFALTPPLIARKSALVRLEHEDAKVVLPVKAIIELKDLVN